MMALGLTILLVEQYARRALEVASREYVLVAGQKVMGGNRSGNPKRRIPQADCLRSERMA